MLQLAYDMVWLGVRAQFLHVFRFYMNADKTGGGNMPNVQFNLPYNCVTGITHSVGKTAKVAQQLGAEVRTQTTEATERNISEAVRNGRLAEIGSNLKSLAQKYTKSGNCSGEYTKEQCNLMENFIKKTKLTNEELDQLATIQQQCYSDGSSKFYYRAADYGDAKKVADKAGIKISQTLPESEARFLMNLNHYENAYKPYKLGNNL